MHSRWSAAIVLIAVSFVSALAQHAIAEAPSWPAPTRESRPWVYNWWMGSAVDEPGLEAQCDALEKAGFGGFHVIPIYGAEGAEARYRRFLSKEWMEAFATAVRIGARHGLGVDLTMGSGWCFGGPQISPSNGCWRLKPRADGRPPYAEPLPTGQMVKRAGPGGKGLMMDPYSVEAMDAFLRPFAEAFDRPGAVRPLRMYHDSFEYYGAGWTPRFFKAFRAKRGYDLKDHWETFAGGKGDPDYVARLKCYYRETLSDLIIDDVFPKWVEWCHARDIGTRNEAHGATANWLDFYALADCPETEMFGRDNRDVLISKFASSAAHVSGRKYVSAEACTWVNEHFCETPLDYKRMLDRLLVSGVDRVYYHGLCYSPTDVVWPGWCFYASSETNPRNPLWRDFGCINAYVTRVQSIMQSSVCDSDVLVYWPIYDLWTDPSGFERMLTVHKTDWFYSQPIGRIARALYDAGCQFDYISDRQLRRLHLGSGAYRKIIVPEAKYMPLETARALVRLAGEGFDVLFVGGFPKTVPGVMDYERRTSELLGLFSNPPKGVVSAALGDIVKGVRTEPFTAGSGLSAWRRKDKSFTYYFVVNNGARPVSGSYRLSVPSGAVWTMDPVDGTICGARGEDGFARLSLGPYASVVLAVSAETDLASDWVAQKPVGRQIAIEGPWTLAPVCGGPMTPPVRTMEKLSSWSRSPNGEDEPFCGTMRYRGEFSAVGVEERPAVIDLGKVCHSARVTLNGCELGCRFMPPYRFEVPRGVLRGRNELCVEVTSTGANRIRWNDRMGVRWKTFHDINMISVKGVGQGGVVPLDASDWPLSECGLLGPVILSCRRLR